MRSGYDREFVTKGKRRRDAGIGWLQHHLK
jgi:hypothetical protein